jgi:ribosomal 30S subunit maturation factor RimM
MSQPADFLPPQNGELHEWEIQYVELQPHSAVVGFHRLHSKSAANALRSFDRTVPRHGKILKVRKV